MSGLELTTLRLPVRRSTAELREQLINETDDIECDSISVDNRTAKCSLQSHKRFFMLPKTKEFLNCWCSYESNKFTKDFLLLIACSFLVPFTDNA